MPQQRRFRRLGSTSAAVSLGALTLVITGAGPAGADTTKGCARGADPITTLKNVPCRLENITGDTLEITGDITSGITDDDSDPQPAGPQKKPTRPQAAPRGSTPPKPVTRRETPFTVTGVRTIRLPRPDGALPASQAGVSRLLPQPHVAAAPPSAGPQPAAANRLVAPMSATDPQQTRLLAVAAAAGLAGAMGALNLSVAGRRLRRPRPEPRA